MADPTREEFEARIRQSGAEAETKIARLEGKIDTLAATLVGEIRGVREDVRKSDQYNRDTRWVLFIAILTAAAAVCGLVVGMATYGDAIFGRGMVVRDVIQTTIKETLDRQNAVPRAPAKPQQ